MYAAIIMFNDSIDCALIGADEETAKAKMAECATHHFETMRKMNGLQYTREAYDCVYNWHVDWAKVVAE